MTMWQTGAAIAAVAAIAQAAAAQDSAGDTGFLDFTLPDLSASTDEAGGYVDPQIKNREQCLDHPGRPAWVMVQPRGMEWRRRLLLVFGQAQIAKRIVETGDCGCDNRFPDWETFRPAMDDLLAPFEQVPVAQMPEGQFSEIQQVRRVYRREATKVGVERGRICRGTR